MFPPSRLALFSEKFIQASWLVALIIAPLFFNIYSSRVFEPDKIALIRTIALAMGALWLVLRAERWRGGRAAGSKDATPTSLALGQRVRAWVGQVSNGNPLTLPALFLLMAYIVSTVLSVSPTVSLFGSYQRLQGLYTFTSYLVIFFLAASLIRTRADIERGITLALVVSFPIALYGIIQHYFVDPLPWVGDVTTRVASNLGNSIFVGAFLILAIPLALTRWIQTTERAATGFPTRMRRVFYAAAIASLVLVGASWGLAFDLGAKPIIEGNYNGTLTPPQLALASSAFNLALLISCIIVALWGAAAFLLKQRVVNFLLTGLYGSVLALQLVALVFSQSRGPLLGLGAGLFTFGVLFALVRGVRKVALGIVGLIALLFVVVALINIPNSPLSSLRELPYVGRMGRVFELDQGTGRVRVLIWQGALQLVVPHEPLWSPLTGDDPFNVVRPLIGYGPETMYVSYNRFYPPELGNIESRNATPDRSHNETFDALVTTGLFGFIAENILFLTIFYFALKWLGFISSARDRNLFVALWYGGGILLCVIFGLVFGWEFIGVALPGGMMLGMFTYLVSAALRGDHRSGLSAPLALLVVALTALFVSHFIEIHFGIAIVSTRVYFWFFAAVFVVIGTRKVDVEATELVEGNREASEVKQVRVPAPTMAARKKRAAPQNPGATRTRKEPIVRRVSSTPLIAYAFLVGFMLAVMAYDYINTNNLGALGSQAVSGLDIVKSALTIKQTTAGGMTSLAMLWLFVTTLLVGLGLCAGEWGRTFQLGARDWGVAVLLFIVLAIAIFSGLAFYHVLLLRTTGTSILEALLTAVVLFTVFMLLVVTMVAITLLFDEALPSNWVQRATNWVVAPVLVLLAAVLIFSTNIEPIRADLLYKQAVSLTGQDNANAIAFFQRALEMQPQQDYYDLFLGRAYLDAAKATSDARQQSDYLKRAEDTLLRARAINPYNTDHSANLARLAQARGALASDPAVKIESYKQADVYFAQANRLSPNTAHLYDQHAQALLEYAGVLEENKNPEAAEAVRQQAREQIDTALGVDGKFCLTHAVRAQADTQWRERVADALNAISYAPFCGDVFYGEGLGIAVNELGRASDEAIEANQGAEFEIILNNAAATNPTLEIYTTLANYYSKSGKVEQAIAATGGALAHIAAEDTETRKRYQDFRFTLVELQKALDAARASPNDPEAQRAVAGQWLARGQLNFALPAFRLVLALKPDDYAAHRSTALLLIATEQFSETLPELTFLEAHAPQTEVELWQKLGQVLHARQSGDTNRAGTLLEELAKTANTQDFALVSALRKLAESLKGAG